MLPVITKFIEGLLLLSHSLETTCDLIVLTSDKHRFFFLLLGISAKQSKIRDENQSNQWRLTKAHGAVSRRRHLSTAAAADSTSDYYVSSTSASLEPSYVLRALGVDEVMAHSSIRFGIGKLTTEEEIDKAVRAYG
ncbi:unnamed protein product [Brassica oleracea var. botrytis]